MTIRRQYSQPNCTLILEGLSDNPSDSHSINALMSILVNAECHFLGSNKLMSGGRVFFENLTRTVSAYAQEFMSGLRHPVSVTSDSQVISLEKDLHKNVHRLKIQTEADSDLNNIEVELTTVQLFDLIETIDQFLADDRTLPDLTIDLHPVSKRYRQVEEPFLERATPAVLGVTSLAALALAVSFMPIPSPKVPEPETKQQSNPSQTLPKPSESSTPETIPDRSNTSPQTPDSKPNTNKPQPSQPTPSL